MPVFYDTHAHLDHKNFAADLPQMIARAHAAGIGKIICIGTDLASSARGLEIAEQFPNVFAAVGWHPTHVLEAPEDIRPALRELARHPKAVAIGETGLDFYHPPDHGEEAFYRKRQAEIFQQQLEVAAETGLNCVVHTRQSFEVAAAQLEPFAGKVRGVFHCFSEDGAALQRVLSLGSLVSFTGNITFKNAQKIRDTLAAAPLGQFMLETDCPYLAPMPHRGQRCEPAYVKEISELAAQVKNCSLEELSRATCDVAHRFFPKLG